MAAPPLTETAALGSHGQASEAAVAGPRRFWLRAVVAVAAMVVAWRILAVGIAAHEESRSAAEAALGWYGQHPQANYRAGRAAQAAGQDPGPPLLRALTANPTHAWTLAALAEHWYGRGDLRRADDAAMAAAALAPHDAPLHLRLAEHWLRRDDVAAALAAWGTALSADPRLSRRLHPVLLRLAQAPGGMRLMARAVRAQAPWWPGFFAYGAAEADLETLRALMALRESLGPASAEERAGYVRRLQQENQWGEAYMAWLNGLEPAQRRLLGTLFNGGFEQPLSGSGFGWHATETPIAAVATGRTYGTGGQGALQVVFRNQARPFHHVHQPLFLAPGRYRLRGRARPDNLEALEGVRWQVACAGSGEPLGHSNRFVGVDQWRAFWFQFRVPATGCGGQELRLVSVGDTAADHRVQGAVWFDDLTIQPW